MSLNAEERKKRLIELANEFKVPEKAMMELYDRHYN